ncbi:hypothetical protein [Paenibacillus agilis]|uniref:Uncharacterized protein n=1 Tax=Paenibacillus agilis TaxID=3020863 RepID=A0A559IYL0_9BACL|nr:hypothetical protein [Paenibacillus agilis]TVX92677.1 hypothetical protein FPZ44_06225 [Paenibacillus agilis]
MIKKLTVASVLAVALLGSAVGVQAAAVTTNQVSSLGYQTNSYGAEAGVKSLHNIPPGWVHVRTTGPSWDQTFIIKNLNGAPYGAEVGIKSFYNLPSGWVHVSTTGPSWDQTFIIKNLNGAPSGAQVGVKSFYNIPVGWVHISTTGPSWDQTYIYKKL